MEGDTLLGDGLASVILNFENIGDNLKRGEIPSRTEAKKRKIVTPHSKKCAYGCISYAPDMTEEDYEEQQAAMKTVAAKHVKKEELTEEDIATAGRCYPFQRKTVIESSKDANPVIIFSQIPLENKKVFYNHLLQLTGHNFSESFNDITKKLKKP